MHICILTYTVHEGRGRCDIKQKAQQHKNDTEMPHLPCTINSVRSLHQIFIKQDTHSNAKMCATKESVTEIQACASGHYDTWNTQEQWHEAVC